MRHTLLLFIILWCIAPASGQKYFEKYASGRYEQAIKLADKAIDNNSKDFNAYLIRAMSHVHLYADTETRQDYPSGPASALSTLKTIQRKDKSGDFIAQHIAERDTILLHAYALAEQWYASKQYKRANNLLDDLIEYHPQPEFFYLKGMIASLQNDHALAVQCLNDAASKIWLDAKTGYDPDPKQYVIFADLADALAEDDDFWSALEVYNRGIRLYGDTDISERCLSLVTNIIGTRIYGLDTIVLSQMISYIDSLPPQTQNKEAFHALKWQAVWRIYALMEQWNEYGAAAHPETRLLQFACADRYTAVQDTLLAGMFRETALVINTKGAYVTNGSDKLQAYTDALICMHDMSQQQAEENVFEEYTAVFKAGNYQKAGELLFNIRAAGMAPQKVKEEEKALFAHLQSLSANDLNTVDLYSMSLMFPDNAIGKKIQKDESVRQIATMLDKKQFSAAGVKLRTQMQLDPTDATVKALYKKWVVDDYIEHFMGSATYIDLETWNGSTNSCTPGTLPDSVHDKVLERLNYVRRLAGVPDNCVFRDSWNAKCMSAALMMSANGDLSHQPPKDWSCYSVDGYMGASNSNLSLGYGGSEALMGQVDDDGGNNEAVGHRRWILNPDRKVFGHGSTPGSMALWALGGVDANYPDNIMAQFGNAYVAWPAPYYFPAHLVPMRWSLSRSGADFDEATVEMYVDGKRIEVDVLPLSYGYGDATLVWVPAFSTSYVTAETNVKVVVKNVVITGDWDERADAYTRSSEDYTYTVTLLPMF